MHIADGILPASVCVAAQVVAWAGVSIAGRKLEPKEVSKMGLLASAAFVTSLVQFPVAATSVHLGLFGLLGVLLGRRAFPVVFAALLFQTLLFQHGGLLTLGVNALNMGAGAMAGWAIWRLAGVPEGPRAFAAGFAGALLPAVLMAAEFAAVDYGRGLYFLVALYAPVAAAEGAITMAAVVFFRRTRPEILSGVTA
jgi:cobalt/nickel transport system permease protein